MLKKISKKGEFIDIKCINNSAKTNIGGVYIDESKKITFETLTLERNSALLEVGGMRLKKIKDLKIINSKIF